MKIMKVFVCCCLCSMLFMGTLYARAGGGGSGGGSGGTGGSGGSSSSTPSSSNTHTTPMDVFFQIGFVGILLGGASYTTCRYRYRIFKKYKGTSKLLKELDDIDAFWQEDTIKAQIEEIYYIAQAAWSNKNPEPLKSYVSDELYENWKMKLDWMDVRHERNILENVKLLSSNIVCVYDSKNDEHDFLWVCIRGKMVDYKVDETENQIIEGDTRSHEFIEYWKFIRKEDLIILDEVRQQAEMDIDTLVNLSEELHNEEHRSSLRHH